MAYGALYYANGCGESKCSTGQHHSLGLGFCLHNSIIRVSFLYNDKALGPKAIWGEEDLFGLHLDILDHHWETAGQTSSRNLEQEPWKNAASSAPCSASFPIQPRTTGQGMALPTWAGPSFSHQGNSFQTHLQANLIWANP